MVEMFSELKVFHSLCFFMLSLSLYFWWVSLSSSVSLMMVLVFSSLSAVSYSLFLKEKIPLFMIVLTLSGGLFILFSFVIMFFPDDYKYGVIDFHKITFFFFFFFLISLFVCFFDLGEFFVFNSEESYSLVKVWGNFVFVYIFLIILLFLFLFLVNSIVDPGTGSMFSKKKSSG